MTFNKNELVEQLKKYVCEVIFTKADGTERVMKCTLKEDVLKPFMDEIEERNTKLLQEGKEIKPRKENPNLVTVIDTDKNEWRAFKVDSIKTFKTLEE